jgi:hypothetical protein
LLLSIGAGSGLLYLLRWYWWRINAWSEIAAMASRSWCRSGFSWRANQGAAVDANVALLVTVFATSIAWITVTFATRPEAESTLVRFYQLVRPAGPLWGPIPRESRRRLLARQYFTQLLGWVLAALSYIRPSSAPAARSTDTLRRAPFLEWCG